jgi:uncharacterized membrane-anchored protein
MFMGPETDGATTAEAVLSEGTRSMNTGEVVRGIVVAAALIGMLVAPRPAASQQPPEQSQAEKELQSLAWQRGPVEAQIDGVAAIKVPEGQAFLDGPNTRRFLELNGNPPRDKHYTLVASDLSWFAIFSFESSGYVKDDEKLDADALLAALQKSDTPANKERERLGMTPLHTVGWSVLPHYEPGTKQLEWGVRLRRADGQEVVNYTIRLLGRRGVMHATLVCDPASLQRDVATFKASLAGYSFVSGERYAEFRAGDRVAEYGLAALVLGGAAVVATKSGFGKAIGKLAIFGLIAVGGAVTAFVRKVFRRA